MSQAATVAQLLKQDALIAATETWFAALARLPHENPEALGAVGAQLGTTLFYAGMVEPARNIFAQLPPGPQAQKMLVAMFCAGAPVDAVTQTRAVVLSEMLRDRPARAPVTRPIDLSRPIRVGHLVNDVRFSAAEYFRRSELVHLDRSAFRLIHYVRVASPPPADAHPDDLWVDASAMDPAALFDRIQADAVDIVADYCDILSGGAIAALAARPAPLWLGCADFVAASGLPHRWTLSDPVSHGPGLAEPMAERDPILPLPTIHCFSPSAPPSPIKTRSGPPVFGVFAQPPKISDAALRAWAAILAAVPDARLVIKRRELASTDAKTHLLRRLSAAGVPLQRVGMAGATDHAAHLAAYGAADICLDSFPFGGHTTTCEALIQGLPIVSLMGDQLVGRIGPAYQTAAGCAQWIARDVQDYINIAVALSRDVPTVRAGRAALAEQARASAMCDGRGWTRALEAGYRHMAEVHNATLTAV